MKYLSFNVGRRKYLAEVVEWDWRHPCRTSTTSVWCHKWGEKHMHVFFFFCYALVFVQTLTPSFCYRDGMLDGRLRRHCDISRPSLWRTFLISSPLSSSYISPFLISTRQFIHCAFMLLFFCCFFSGCFFFALQYVFLILTITNCHHDYS